MEQTSLRHVSDLSRNETNLGSVASYSVHSLAEGSEPISEVQEIQEVEKLRADGDAAYNNEKYRDAVKFYSDALEIDENNIELYCCRAATYIRRGQYEKAHEDVNMLLSLSPENPQGYYLQGIVLDNRGSHQDALSSFLLALDLDIEHTDIITNSIANVASRLCDFPKDLSSKFSDMDAYRRLCEIGVCLFQAGKHEMCAQILTAAQKHQTNQKGITMRVQLTLANAHAALKQMDVAISIYQDCFLTALSAHDYNYQTKALVNIATLFLEMGDTHQAIIYYEKLLALEQEIRGGVESDSPVLEYWTEGLQTALHVNLSIAYKDIGNMSAALLHAQKYMELIRGRGDREGESHHNLGALHEILGDYKQALMHYQKFLELSKRHSDKKGLAQAYGSLGSIYARLGNDSLAVTYHEQHIVMVSKMNDPKLTSAALEQFGDTYCILKNYDKAIECFTDMGKSAHNKDVHTKVRSLCKIGKAHRAQNRVQYSIYFYEQAKSLATEMQYQDIIMLCEYNLACLLKHSTQMKDLDEARKYFARLIPVLEAKIQLHKDENSFCAQESQEQLNECYDGMQLVLSKLGNKEECLQYAESYRKRSLTQMQNFSTSLAHSMNTVAGGFHRASDVWSMDKMCRVVMQANCIVLYYSVLPECFLLWVLHPGRSDVRFYAGKPPDGGTVNDYISKLVAEFRTRSEVNRLNYECENRALPQRGQELNLMRKKNLHLSKSFRRQQLCEEFEKETDKLENEEKTDSEKPQKSATRKLYDYLIAPVEDILSENTNDNSIIIVPDKMLCELPFNILQDWNGAYLNERFRITHIPSLFLVEKATNSEMDFLKLGDELEFERAESSRGGLSRMLQGETGRDFSACSCLYSESIPQSVQLENLNPRMVSNPRLLKSGGVRTRTPRSSKNSGLTRENTGFSERSVKVTFRTKAMPSSLIRSSTSLSMKSAPAQLTGAQRILGLHSLNTLTSKTSTNTDIISSNSVVTQFKQVSGQDKCMVLANPLLPKSLGLYGGSWVTAGEMKCGQQEAIRVASYLDIIPVFGADATKDNFLKEIPHATVLHICTVASWEEGALVMSPNPCRMEDGDPLEHSYLVTTADILNVKLKAQLVVLSCGWSTHDHPEMNIGCCKLPSAFLAAGAQCVLVLLWPVPNSALEKFYFHFYQNLQQKCCVSVAVKNAAERLRDDNRFSSLVYWSPFYLIGKDVEVDLKHIRHDMLDQTLDRVERDVCQSLLFDPLNPQPACPVVETKEKNMENLQDCLSELISHHRKQTLVIPELIQLLDGALKRLHTQEQNRHVTQLPDSVLNSTGSLRFLRLLMFHFQAKGTCVMDPIVLYPHWNPDDLLIPAYDALKAVTDLVGQPLCAQAVYELFPVSQDVIANLVDVMCITKHAPEIQLKVTDLSVKPLWQNTKVKAVLTAVGFHQVGLLLNFNNTPENRRILTSCMQLFIAVSINKSPILIHKLDVNLLGGPNTISKSDTSSPDPSLRLPSLTPLIVPRHQLRMSTPWSTSCEHPDEMQEKMKLARSKTETSSDFSKHLRRAKTWHHTILSSQASEEIGKVGRPKASSSRVKVVGGMTASANRVPVDKEQEFALPLTNERRDYAHFVLHQRLDSVMLRHRDSVRKLYLPYVQNV